MKIALILPAYNEAKTIGATLRDFHRAMPDLLFCVVDNNSDDDTVKVARETCAALPGCRLRLIREKRQGKALAVRRAFTEVEADVYVMADADSTYGACDLLPQHERALVYSYRVTDAAGAAVGVLELTAGSAPSPAPRTPRGRFNRLLTTAHSILNEYF